MTRPDFPAIVTTAYAFVWRERRAFVRLAVPAVAGLATLAAVSGQLAGGQAAATSHDAALLALRLFVMVVLVQFAVAWHRHRLQAEEPVRLRGTYRLGGPQLRYLLVVIGLGVATAPIGAGAWIFSHYAAGLFVEPASPWFAPAAWLLSLPLLTPAALLAARLAPSLPAIAIGRHLSLRESWRLTRGFGWPLLGAALLAWGPAGLFGTAALALAPLFAKQGPVIVLLPAFAGFLLWFVAAAVVSTAVSDAWRELAGAAQPSASAEPARAPRTGIGKWLLDAAAVGLVFGGAAFVYGFLVHPRLHPSNLAPLMGFVLAPLGFLVGLLLGLAPRIGKLGVSRMAGIGIVVATFALAWGLLMAPWFMPGFIARGMLLDAAWLPSPIQRALAPAGILRVWAIGIPPQERAGFLRRMSPYFGGPLLTIDGYYRIEFVDDGDLAERLRRAQAEGHGPDVLVGDAAAPIAGLAGEPDMASRLARVVGNFSYRGIGGVAFVDRESPNAKLARELALRDLQCRNDGLADAVPADLAFELREWSVTAASAIVAGKGGAEEAPESASRMRLEHPAMAVEGAVDMVSSRFCGAWGSSTLAFASVVVNFDASDVLGQRRLLLALRKEAGVWRILSASELAASHDSVVHGAQRLQQVMLNRYRDAEAPQPGVPLPPRDFVPADHARQRSGYLLWEPNPSPRVVAELAEIACRTRDRDGAPHDDVQLELYLRTAEERPRFYVHANKACPEGWPWKWRIWTLAGGAIGFSEEAAIPTAVR